MLKILLLSRFRRRFTVDKITFRRRMRKCQACIVYDRTLKRCRPYSGAEQGCGCYVPFKAVLSGASGWATEADVAEATSFCW